jgi:formylglycine-generating enzyme required for sulfatase activity
MFEDDSNTKFYLDDEPVTVAEFNAFFYANDVGWSEEIKGDKLILTIFTDEAR